VSPFKNNILQPQCSASIINVTWILQNIHTYIYTYVTDSKTSLQPTLSLFQPAISSLPAVWQRLLTMTAFGSLPTPEIFESSLMLQPTVGRPMCLGIKHPSGAYNQMFITVRQLRVNWCGALSLTRRRVCRLQLLLAFPSAVIFGSESRGTRDHILLSQIRNFPFCRLLRLAGLRWRYSA
jgi:hypothetical protein